jgi:hypothetical protein
VCGLSIGQVVAEPLPYRSLLGASKRCRLGPVRLYLDEVVRTFVDTEPPILKMEMHSLPEIRMKGCCLSELGRSSTPEYGETGAYINCAVGARLQSSASSAELSPNTCDLSTVAVRVNSSRRIK